MKYDLAKFYEKIADFQKSAAMYEEFVATYELAVSQEARADATAKGRRPVVVAQASPRPLKTIDVKALKDEGQKKERAALIEKCTDKADNWVQNALYNASLWYEATGELERAIAAKQGYLARFKDDAVDAPLIAAEVGALLERQGKLAEASKANDAVLAAFGKDPRLDDGRILELKHRQLRIEEKRKSLPDVDRAAKDLIAVVAEDQRARSAERSGALCPGSRPLRRTGAGVPKLRRAQVQSLLDLQGRSALPKRRSWPSWWQRTPTSFS